MTDKEAKRLLEKLKKNNLPPIPHFCAKCGIINEEIIKREITEIFKVKGDTEVTVTGYAAYCPHCGSRISDECDTELNLAAYREYRKINGLLQPEEIKAIREKYGLSARQFAMLLNLGDHVVYDLERGAIASVSVDNSIRSVMTFGMLKKHLSTKKTKLSAKETARLLALCYNQADICNEKNVGLSITIVSLAPLYA